MLSHLAGVVLVENHGNFKIYVYSRPTDRRAYVHSVASYRYHRKQSTVSDTNACVPFTVI